MNKAEPMIFLLHKLLQLSYKYGFCAFPIKMLAEKAGINDPKTVYDSNTETGLLAEYVTEGYLYCLKDSLGVSMDMKEILEREVDFRP